MVFKTIYLTGAPAAGKSSITRKLRDLNSNLEVWEYGERLTSYLNNIGIGVESQDKLRAQSARIVTSEHISQVDRHLLDWVNTNRHNRHLLIDSHPVTKEHYGYRVTAFSAEKILELKPDEIWVLFTSPEIAVDRIANDAAGRPQITLEEARLHTYLQGSLAISYGISVGRPVYFFDSTKPVDKLSSELAARLN
jgi:adenylate kinase